MVTSSKQFSNSRIRLLSDRYLRTAAYLVVGKTCCCVHMRHRTNCSALKRRRCSLSCLMVCCACEVHHSLGV